MAKTAASNTRKTTNKKAAVAKTADVLLMNHAEGADGIDALLAELTSGEPTIVEQDAPGAEAAGSDSTDVVLPDHEVEHTIGRLEAIDASIEAALPSSDDSAAQPTGETSDAPPIEGAAADGDAAPAAPKAQRKHYANKLDRIKDRLGAAAADYTVLTLADAGVSDDDLKQVMESTFAIIEGMNKKQKDHASQLYDFLTGKKASMRAVHEIVLKTMARDGFVTTGEKGNVITEMLGKPYSMGSARAMSGNAIGMMADLKLLKSDGKGRYVGNPESTLLAAANQKLGLNTAAAATV